MGLSKKPYKGTRDFFPKEKRIQDYMFQMMKKTAESFGYESYDGPLLEEVELYKAKSGEELINEQIYSFEDRGNRFVAIRPEMTPTVARMVANIHKEVSKPIRWFSIPNLMRYEKPQKGRLREHWQFNCDIFGASDRWGEIEILQVAVNLLKSFGANSSMFEIQINDREIVDCIFKNILKVDSETSYRLYKIIDKSKKVPKDAVSKMLDEQTKMTDKEKVQFFEYLELKSFSEAVSYLEKNNQKDNTQSLKSLIDQINILGLEEYIKYDPAIVRGLDYYTGIVFEIFDKHPDNRRAICGGGAYANLLKIFNEEPLAGVGFGLGDVTLKDFLETHNLLPDLSLPKNDLYITFQDENCLDESLKLAQNLREKDLNVVTNFSALKFKKVFSNAEKAGAKFVSLIGQKELDNKSILIKNLKSKEQKEFKLNQIEEVYSFIIEGNNE